MPGLLLSQKMQTPLAADLAGRGNRVVTFDFLGHGDSDRPQEMGRYSMPEFARQAVALLDHLELEQAVVGGTSLGANVTLEVAALAPERVRGMVIEMPVLDKAIPVCAAAFTPLLFALTYGEPAMKGAGLRRARAVPRQVVPFMAELVLDWIAQDPGRAVQCSRGSCSAAPPRSGPCARPSRRRRWSSAIRAIPCIPFSDADMLAAELPGGRLIDANSIIELRVSPERLTGKIAAFVDECWDGSGSAEPARTAARA